MESFTRHQGLVAPLPRSNVDTDAILPKQYLKMMQRTGFGRYLFDEWRYLDPGLPGDDCSTRRPNPEFVLNQARHLGASILLTGANFGCGSSREHAPWALREFGLRAIVAPGFADIFANNCAKNGLALIALPASLIDTLFAEVEANPGYTFAIDLPSQVLTEQNGRRHRFEFDAFRKRCLLQGLSEIELGLQQAQAIRDYERWRACAEPWVFAPMA